jgi:hypothetical protein
MIQLQSSWNSMLLDIGIVLDCFGLIGIILKLIENYKYEVIAS